MLSVTLPEVEIIGYWPSYNPPAGLDNVMGPGAGTLSSSQSSMLILRIHLVMHLVLTPVKLLVKLERIKH